MRVLGVDPGTLHMGVGVVDEVDGGLAFAYSCVLSPAKSGRLSERLHYLHERILALIRELEPTVVAVEEPFVARNVRSAMAVGQAQAVAMVAAEQCGLSVFGYSPREVKMAVTDYGGASKAQVKEMVGVLLGLSDKPSQPYDATDALAVAICHLSAARVHELAIRE